jgi:betaine-aldehyde dehydrogenase
MRVSRKIRAGIFWVNTYHNTYNEAPWGGFKMSGIGRDLGTYGFQQFIEPKQINIKLNVSPAGWLPK